MCGIAGAISLGDQRADVNAVQRMIDALEHRGPDDQGIWTDGKVCFGHRRLSIIDLSENARQPLVTLDGRYVTTSNGEIYNYKDLIGDWWTRSRSDNEAIPIVYEKAGIGGFNRLDGMFAFGLYDRNGRRVMLVRDRFGVKPLYYAEHDGQLFFASEPKALFAGGVRAEIEPSALAEYMTFQNTFRADTIWRGVKILLPGEYMLAIPGEQGTVVREWHSGFPTVERDMTAADAEERVLDAFGKAVERQLVSDVEVGSYLSGGLDSGSIVSFASQHVPRLKTFTGGFDLTNVTGIEQGNDEREMSELVSHRFQTEHYSVVLHSGDMPAAMDRIVEAIDDPRVGMCHPFWYLAKLSSKFVKVALSGTGGDELFGGYPWRYTALNGTTDAEVDRILFATADRLGDRRTILSEHMGGFIVGDGFREVMVGAPSVCSGDALRRILHFEFKTFLHGMLVVEDRLAMAHGLEVRVPFLDNALADLAFQIPSRLKVDVHDDRGGKLILRSAMKGRLPNEILAQPKRGFSPPDENWYRGESMDYIKSVLYDPQTLQRPWFDQEVVEAKLQEHFTGCRNHRLLIWSLLMVELLQRRYVA